MNINNVSPFQAGKLHWEEVCGQFVLTPSSTTLGCLMSPPVLGMWVQRSKEKSYLTDAIMT